MSVGDGGPAFPQISELGDIAATSNGMSLRDWFAGQALTGVLSMQASPEMFQALEFAADSVNQKGIEFEAIVAYKYADAMLAAREVDA